MNVWVDFGVGASSEDSARAMIDGFGCLPLWDKSVVSVRGPINANTTGQSRRGLKLVGSGISKLDLTGNNWSSWVAGKEVEYRL